MSHRQQCFGVFSSCGKAFESRTCSFLFGFKALRRFLRGKKNVAGTQNLEMTELMVLELLQHRYFVRVCCITVYNSLIKYCFSNNAVLDHEAFLAEA